MQIAGIRPRGICEGAEDIMIGQLKLADHATILQLVLVLGVQLTVWLGYGLGKLARYIETRFQQVVEEGVRVRRGQVHCCSRVRVRSVYTGILSKLDSFSHEPSPNPNLVKLEVHLPIRLQVRKGHPGSIEHVLLFA